MKVRFVPIPLPGAGMMPPGLFVYEFMVSSHIDPVCHMIRLSTNFVDSVTAQFFQSALHQHGMGTHRCLLLGTVTTPPRGIPPLMRHSLIIELPASLMIFQLVCPSGLIPIEGSAKLVSTKLQESNWILSALSAFLMWNWPFGHTDFDYRILEFVRPVSFQSYPKVQAMSPLAT